MLNAIIRRTFPSAAARRSLRILQGNLKETVAVVFREAWFGNRRRAAQGQSLPLLVNIGCGELAKPGWENLDAGKPNKSRRYYNALNPLPFLDSAVEHIHAEHFLEHLEYLDGCRLLGQCHRVLQANGSLRIIVPDLERYVQAYSVNDKSFFNKFESLGGSTLPLSTRALVCNQMFRMGGDHKFAWDFETLAAALTKLGFTQIERSKLNDVDARYAIDGQDWWREAESLYVNARKG